MLDAKEREAPAPGTTPAQHQGEQEEIALKTARVQRDRDREENALREESALKRMRLWLHCVLLGGTLAASITIPVTLAIALFWRQPEDVIVGVYYGGAVLAELVVLVVFALLLDRSADRGW